MAVVARGKVLEDNRDFLEFLQKVEQVEVWIRQKVWRRYRRNKGGDSVCCWMGADSYSVCCCQEVMINVGDVGEDYEHGLQLLKKLNEFRGSGSRVSMEAMCVIVTLSVLCM